MEERSNIISTIILSVALCVFVTIIVFTDETAPLYAKILYPFWGLSLIPSYAYLYYRAKERLSKLDFAQGARLGVIFYGLISLLLFIIPIFAAPIFMVLYCIQLSKLLKNK